MRHQGIKLTGGPTRRVIPCLDVRDGRVVKGVKFQGLRDMGDPAELASRYEREGADEIVMLDVSATEEGRAAAVRTVAAIRAVLGIPLTVGGGVRTVDDAARLLDAGADRVSVNTAAVRRPEMLSELAERFGVQCVVIAVDAAAVPGRHGRWSVLVKAGKERTDLDAVEWSRRAAVLGAGEVLLTSWDRDGGREGYDIDLIRAVSGAGGAGGLDVPVVASGGAATAEHMAAALGAGADAVLAASIFHEGEFTVDRIKQLLAETGVEVRR